MRPEQLSPTITTRSRLATALFAVFLIDRSLLTVRAPAGYQAWLIKHPAVRMEECLST